MRTIVCTTGTSIAQGAGTCADDARAKELYAESIRARLSELRSKLAGNLKDYFKRASAESNSLISIDASARDRIILLHSETPDGEVCAKELHRMLAQDLGNDAELRRIVGLQVMDARRFRREGIQNLFAALDSVCKPLLDNPEAEVLLNATGGFKSVVPYLTLYGLLKRLPVIYIFERSNALITLPPAPINFDYERLSRATDALSQLRKEGAMPGEDFFQFIPGLAYHERSLYETLLEEDRDGLVTLSAFGLLLAGTLEREQAQVLLSPTAVRQYESSRSFVRDQFTFMLERVRDPLWRHGKLHTFRGTGLDVFKPGNTGERMACILRGSQVFVCELLRHDEYERVLPGKGPGDYDLALFKPWARPEGTAAPPATEEEALRSLHDKYEEALSAWEAAEQQYQNECEKTASLQNRIREVEAELEETRGALAGLRTPWWRRWLKRVLKS